MFRLALLGALWLAYFSPAFAAAILGFPLIIVATLVLIGLFALASALILVRAPAFEAWAFHRSRVRKLLVFMFCGVVPVSCLIAGCAPTGNLNADIATFNAQVANDLPTACALVASADAAFQTVAATGKLSAAALSTEKSAMAGVASICANPGAVNAATALQTLANAYAAVVEAGKPGT